MSTKPVDRGFRQRLMGGCTIDCLRKKFIGPRNCVSTVQEPLKWCGIYWWS